MKNDCIITRRTDWTKYYEQPKSIFSAFTQRFTLKKIVSIIRKELGNNAINVLEFGGGNSCFAHELKKEVQISSYAIIDNNKLAVEKAQERYPYMDCCLADARDKNVQNHINKEYDFVYSVGLIEHFRGIDIKSIIANHFECAKKDGIVMITFPTPTVKYKITRKIMEFLNCWQFYDEKPIRWREVESYFSENGIVLEHTINRKLFLTQMVVVARKANKK